jgi:membrane protease YdiL (CAAX protease family)
VQWRVGFLWYLIALYGFLVLGLLGIMLYGVASPQEVLSKLPQALINVPVNVLIFVFLGPLGEEMGWRGYALPRLQNGQNALSASVVLGVLWAFWHSPLMVSSEWRSDLPIGAFLIAYPLYIIPLAIIFTSVYNHTGGSVLITTVLHGAFNYTVFALNGTFRFTRYDPLVVQWAINGLLWSVAIALIVISGPAHLSRPPDREAAE